MAPRYMTAIQYDPRHRGLQLALAYMRLEAGSPFRTHDIYGFMVGYCGGWAWGDEYFHVGEKIGAGFVSYTVILHDILRRHCHIESAVGPPSSFPLISGCAPGRPGAVKGAPVFGAA